MSTGYYFRDKRKWKQRELVGAFLQQRIDDYMAATKAFIAAHSGEECAGAVADAENHITTTIGMALESACVESDEEFLCTSGVNQYHIMIPRVFRVNSCILIEEIKNRLQDGDIIVDEYGKEWHDADSFISETIGKLELQ